MIIFRRNRSLRSYATASPAIPNIAAPRDALKIDPATKPHETQSAVSNRQARGSTGPIVLRCSHYCQPAVPFRTPIGRKPPILVKPHNRDLAITGHRPLHITCALGPQRRNSRDWVTVVPNIM